VNTTSEIVDDLIARRPAADFLNFRYDSRAVRITDSIYKSTGITASYLIVSRAGRLVVNTGTGGEAVHHRALFDQVSSAPTRFIITTQAHTDHVGGVAHFREEGTSYVAQANNVECQQHDQQLAGLRREFGAPWFAAIRAATQQLAGRYPDQQAARPGTAQRADLGPLQDRPRPDITFEDRLALRVDDLDVELLATPGGETRDSCIAWLPAQEVCFISNLLGPLFPHFPNFNTLRGDRYRDPSLYLTSLQRLRALHPEVVLTGRGEPLTGKRLLDAALGRLFDAVEFVYTTTLQGINEGKDLPQLMREVVLPDELRVGQSYGRVAWGVRAIWESHVGWFRQKSTTELYPDESPAAYRDLVSLAGADVVVARANERLEQGKPVVAIQLAEAALHCRPEDPAACAVLAAAHERLLADPAAANNFWLRGWLSQQVERWLPA
jgi:glyoxylase-like metal-dependent hydrolase (beta-lactamase superfamily II)